MSRRAMLLGYVLGVATGCYAGWRFASLHYELKMIDERPGMRRLEKMRAEAEADQRTAAEAERQAIIERGDYHRVSPGRP